MITRAGPPNTASPALTWATLTKPISTPAPSTASPRVQLAAALRLGPTRETADDNRADATSTPDGTGSRETTDVPSVPLSRPAGRPARCRSQSAPLSPVTRDTSCSLRSDDDVFPKCAPSDTTTRSANQI